MKLSEAQCDSLFPFRVETDSDGRVRAAGAGMRKLLDLEVGSPVLDQLRIVNPHSVTEWEPERLLDQFLLLESKNRALTLKGELLKTERHECGSPGYYLLCSPTARSSSELNELGLKFSDFPKTSDIAEYFLIINAHEQTAADVRRYVEKLEEKNSSLNYRDRLFSSLIANLPSGGAVLLRQDSSVIVADGMDLPCEGRCGFSEEGVPLESIFGDRVGEIRAILDGKVPIDEAITYDYKDSVYRCAVSYLPHPNNHRARWLLIFQNITEDLYHRSQAERLQRLDSVGHLAGGIAHDFNNYLASILGNISVGLDNPEMCEEALKDAETACEAARQLTRQLLTFSKGGDPVTRVEEVEPVVMDAVKFSLSGSDIAWEVKAPSELWRADFDKGQISQIINNLCVNARQALGGHGRIDVDVTNVEVDNDKYLDDGRYVRIDIRDDGPGISSEVLKKIWDPYFTTKAEGSGLGLATCHSIAERHHGRMAVESTLGVGTTFSIWLPATKDQAHHDVPLEVISEKVASNRILIMDDQAPIRIVASRILSKLDQRVVQVEDGVEAIGQVETAVADGDPFDIVILDLTIPGGMGGEEAVATIKEIDPNVHAVVCSGYTDQNSLCRFQEAGFTAILSKPFTTGEIEGMLAEFTQIQSGRKAQASVPNEVAQA